MEPDESEIARIEDIADPVATTEVSAAAVREEDPAAVDEDGSSTVLDEHAPSVPEDAEARPDSRPGRRGGAVGGLLGAVAGVALTVAAFIGSGTVPLGPSPTPSPEPTFAVIAASVGISSAPVTIEVWADYQCPYCGVFTHGIEPTLVRDYAATGRALVAFRDFAFLGQESVDAAVAARCAGRVGRFWTYHDLLYASQGGENQGAFARKNLDSLATFAALDKTTFDACLANPAVAGEVAAETEVGRGLGISSTPTLRITGPGGTKLVKGITQPDVIAAAVEAVARPAPSASPGASASAGPTEGAPNGTQGSPSPSN